MSQAQSITIPDPLTHALPASSLTQFLPVQTAGSEPAESLKTGFYQSSATAAQISKLEVRTRTPKPDTSPNPLDPGDHGRERTSVAASLQQGAEYDDPPPEYPQQETDIQDKGPSQVPAPIHQGQQNAPFAAEP